MRKVTVCIPLDVISLWEYLTKNETFVAGVAQNQTQLTDLSADFFEKQEANHTSRK